MRPSATAAFKQWKRAALLKDRTRREIRRRARTIEPREAIAEDFGVPLQFVDALAAWQMFESDGPHGLDVERHERSHVQDVQGRGR